MKEIAIFIFIIPFFLFAQANEIEKYIHLNRENEEQYKLHRQQWFDEMDKTAPGLDWRVIENANHLAKISRYQELVNEYISAGKNSKDGMLETIIGASGLRGKWYEKGSNNQAGRMLTADIDFDNNLIYSASSGGNVWRGSLDGNNWTCLNNGLQITGIVFIKVIHIGKKKRIIVAGGAPAGVWFTDDEGLNWQLAKGLDKPQNWGSMQRGVWVKTTNEFYVLSTEWDYNLKKGILAIYRSTDFAENFTPVMKYNISINYCDMWSPEYHYAGVFWVHKDTLSKIENGTIQKLGNINLNKSYSQISRTLLRGSVVNNSVILSMLVDDNTQSNADVYRTTNFTNWYQVGESVPTTTFSRNSFNVSYNDTTVFFSGGIEVWRTEDNGATWNKVNNWGSYYGDPANQLHADIPGIIGFISPQKEEMYLIGTDGGLYISKDRLKTVKNLSLQGLNVSQYYSGYTYRNAKGIYFLGSQDQGFQRTFSDEEDKVDAFAQTISGDYGHLCSSDGGTHLWSVYPGFVMLYENAQDPKHKTYTWSFSKIMNNWLWLPPVVADLDNPKIAYLVSGAKTSSNNNNNRIWKVTFTGTKLEYDSLDYDFRQGSNDRKPSAMAISPLAKDFFYALSNDGKFFLSTDHGQTWQMNDVFKGPSGHYFYGNTVVASQTKFGRVFIAGNGYSSPGAYMSEDHGKNWTALDSGLPKTLIYKIAVTPDDKYIFAATSVGPYVYISDEGRWYDMLSPETPDQTFWSVEYVPDMKTVRFVTYGRGAWDFKITDFTSGVETEKEPALSSDLSVYPNPMNENGKVRLNINKTINGSLLLYDLDGKMVKQIYNGNITQGSSEFEINPRTNDGYQLPDGAYILFLIADGVANYTKVVISN